MELDLSHRQLQSLIHVSNVLNSSLDTDQVIDSIMTETLSVIDAADSGLLFLYDHQEDTLIAKSSIGFNAHIFKNVHIFPGESMSGKTFLAKKCLTFPNQESIIETIQQSMTKETFHLTKTKKALYPFSAICAPILVKERCIGVITIDSFNPDKTFSEADVHLLKAISHQAAVVLEKTRLYVEISKQNQRMKRSIEIHNSIANLVLHGEGIEAIVRYISRFIGHLVFLFDSIGSSLAISPNTKTTKNLLALVEKTVQVNIKNNFSKQHSTDVLEINDKPHTLYMFAIGTKPNFLGYLVILSLEPISEEDRAAIEHACTVISLEMVKEQAIFETEHNIKGEFMEGLLSGQMNHQLIQQAKQLQLDQNRSFQVITISMDKFHPPSMKDYQTYIHNRRNLIHLTRQIFLANHPLGLVVSKYNHIIVLLSYDKELTQTKAFQYAQERSEQFVTELYQRFKQKFHTSIGIGRMMQGLQYVHKSSEDSLKCILFIKNFKLKKSIVGYTDLGSRRLLLNNSKEELMDFVYEVLGPLIHYERQHAKDFLQTLYVYLIHHQKMKETAEELHIHLNTLSYRLKRIEEIIGFDLSQSRQALDVYLAVSLYELLQMKKKIS